MSKRIDKINKHLQRIIGEILLKEADLPEGVLVTISSVATTADLRLSKVLLTVLPSHKAKEVLDMLTPQMYDIQGSLNRSLEFRPLPRIRFICDIRI